VIPVFEAVAGIDHQQVFIRMKAIEIGIVDGAAAIIGDQGVLAFSLFKSGGIVGKDVL